MFFQDLLFRKSQKENKQWIWESFAFFSDNVYKTEIILHSDENFYQKLLSESHYHLSRNNEVIKSES